MKAGNIVKKIEAIVKEDEKWCKVNKRKSLFHDENEGELLYRAKVGDYLGTISNVHVRGD